jgi:hypothetical protein
MAVKLSVLHAGRTLPPEIFRINFCYGLELEGLAALKEKSLETENTVILEGHAAEYPWVRFPIILRFIILPASLWPWRLLSL